MFDLQRLLYKLKGSCFLPNMYKAPGPLVSQKHAAIMMGRPYIAYLFENSITMTHTVEQPRLKHTEPHEK